MRRNLLRGLFALVLVSMSTQVFAGNVGACEFLKDKSHPDYIAIPGLYGLCVAWNNASANGDQTAMDRIAQKYSDKSGGLPVPGSVDPDPDPDPLFACPCWMELTETYICDLGEYVFNTLELVDETDPELADVYQGAVIFLNSSNSFDNFGANPVLTSCAHNINGAGPALSNLTPAEALICGMEIGEIRDMHLSDVCAD